MYSVLRAHKVDTFGLHLNTVCRQRLQLMLLPCPASIVRLGLVRCEHSKRSRERRDQR